jgi:hypothetical protein
LLFAAIALAAAGWIARPAPKESMASAAADFLDSLTAPLRTKAALPFDDKARQDWHYVPRDRAGVEFSELNDDQKLAARRLLRSALSSQGMNKVEEIMLLDSVLLDMEKGKGARRDPLAYSIAIFGSPGAGPWGWKLEGHHISLNFTGSGEATAVTPAFLGANPGEVKQGPRAGVRVLAAEEDLARELLASLTPEQRKEAIIGDAVPADILAVPGRGLDDIAATGLPVSSMDAAQRTLVNRLLSEFAGNLKHDLATHELDRINKAGLDKVRFGWIGSERRGEGHYYRISGPTFVIEYDNTQNNANHVHTVWRDRERDFGRDFLKEHLEHGHGEKK